MLYRWFSPPNAHYLDERFSHQLIFSLAGKHKKRGIDIAMGVIRSAECGHGQRQSVQNQTLNARNLGPSIKAKAGVALRILR
jgi:hypothetical protein